MLTLKNVGDFQFVPEIVAEIVNENIPALEERLSSDWNINEGIQIGKYTSLLPLDYALIMECFTSVKWLVEHGANLNVKGSPSFLTVVRYCDENIIRYLVAHGAKVNERNNVGSDAFEVALYGKKYENLPLIQALGHTVDQYGGNAFRNAVAHRNYDVLDFFINNGVDINYNHPDMVYPFKPTPLCIAARYVDLAMCKYLVAHGADVTLSEKDGMRPYSIALEKGDAEMAEYFKSLEPEKYHMVQNKLDELKPFKLPKAMLDFLQGDRLHFELEKCDFGYIDFFTLTETVPVKVGRQRLLRISKTTGDYTDIAVAWNPKTKKVAFYDMEHETFENLCSFDDFINSPAKYMQKIIEGE